MAGDGIGKVTKYSTLVLTTLFFVCTHQMPPFAVGPAVGKLAHRRAPRRSRPCLQLSGIILIAIGAHGLRAQVVGLSSTTVAVGTPAAGPSGERLRQCQTSRPVALWCAPPRRRHCPRRLPEHHFLRGLYRLPARKPPLHCHCASGQGLRAATGHPVQAVTQPSLRAFRGAPQYFLVVLIFAVIELCLAIAAIVGAEKVRGRGFVGARWRSWPNKRWRRRVPLFAPQIPSVAYNSWKSLYNNDPTAIADIEKTVCRVGRAGSACDASALTATSLFALFFRRAQFQCCGWSSVTDYAYPDNCEEEFGFHSPCAAEVQKVRRRLFFARCCGDVRTQCGLHWLAVWRARQALEDALAPLGAMAAVIATLQVRPRARCKYGRRARLLTTASDVPLGRLGRAAADARLLDRRDPLRPQEGKAQPPRRAARRVRRRRPPGPGRLRGEAV